MRSFVYVTGISNKLRVSFVYVIQQKFGGFVKQIK